MNRLLEWVAKHPIFSVLSIFAIIILPVFVYWLSTYGKTPVDIVAAPSDADILISGEGAKNGTNYLTPGEYSLKASRDGFGTHQDSIVVGDEPIEIPIFLEPQTEEAFELLGEDSERFLEVEGVIGNQMREEGEHTLQRNPILDHLPYRSLIFDIDYRFAEEGDDEKLVLIITTETKQDRDYALAQIENWGYEPSEFKIEYR